LLKLGENILLNVCSSALTIDAVNHWANNNGLDVTAYSYSQSKAKQWVLIKLKKGVVKNGVPKNLQQGQLFIVSGEVAIGTLTNVKGELCVRHEVLAHTFELINLNVNRVLTVSTSNEKSGEDIEEAGDKKDGFEQYKYLEDMSGNYDELLDYKSHY